MTTLELLTTALASPLAKFLIKNYLGEAPGAVGEGLIDIAKRKIKDFGDQREAQRLFDGIADRIVKRLVPLFDGAGQEENLNLEAVGYALAGTLEGRIEAEFFIRRDLDPAVVSKAFRDDRPLAPGQFSEPEQSLYQRALDESVRYIVEVAAQLPRFEAKLAAESLQRLSRIGQEVDSILETVQRIETQVLAGDNNRETQRYEADYRQAVLRNLDYVELFGADITPESRRHALSVAYVSLNLQGRLAGGEKDPRPLPVESVLDTLGRDSRRLLIRGEAGSGKSTLFRWIAIQAAGFHIDAPFRHFLRRRAFRFRGSRWRHEALERSRAGQGHPGFEAWCCSTASMKHRTYIVIDSGATLPLSWKRTRATTSCLVLGPQRYLKAGSLPWSFEKPG